MNQLNGHHLLNIHNDKPWAIEENNQRDKLFHHEAKWHLLELDTANPNQDLSNVPCLVAPITHAVEGTAEPVKYNFTDSFVNEHDYSLSMPESCCLVICIIA